MTEVDIFLRLLTASVAGAILGLDREMRGISAGLRTHAMASLSSAVIVVSSFLIHDQLAGAGETGIDPLRAIQGLAQAIGFIAAGAIFFANGNVRNLTSAANIWLAAGLGIAAGAGQYALVGLAVAFGVLIVTGLRYVERLLPGSDKSGRSAGD